MSRKELAETSRMPEVFNTAPEECDRISLDSAEESTDNSEPESDENESLELLEKKVSATTLFEEQKDVAGAHVFGFRTPKKRDSMAVLASASAQRTPQQSAMPKTPSHTRRLKKKALAKMIRESDSDFSMSESDFEPSGDEEDESSSSDADNDEPVHERRPSVRTPARGSAPKSIQPGPTPRDSSHRSKELAVRRPKADGKRKPVTEYIVQSDLYFSTHSRANPTSDRTLDRLPRLQEADMHTLLMENPATNHSAGIQELIDSCEDSFGKWMGIMDAGFNILLYGLGSKLRVMQLFQQQELKQMPVLVLNGFFPGLALKEILDSVTNNLLDLRLPTSNPHEIVDAIERELSFTPKQHIFLLVHNLDGAGLRNIRTQNVLCHLASIPNIHLLATIDSINAPMMWDTTQLNNFNFYWQDVSTLAPYHVETSFEQSLMVYNAGAPALSSMHSVFSSLTSNGRGVYLAIVRHQLANGGPTNPNYNGMLFKDLYWICREAFLVSSDQALRTQLVEFIDHKMLRGKRTADGAENLIIPVDHDLLQRFFDALPDDQK